MQRYVPTSSHRGMIPVTGDEGGYYLARTVDRRIAELESELQDAHDDHNEVCRQKADLQNGLYEAERELEQWQSLAKDKRKAREE